MEVKEILFWENCSNSMSSEIINESHFLLYSVLSGIIITVVYDVIKIIRNVIPHNGFSEALEDTIFWIFASLFLFSMLYKVNNGTVRWFAIAGTFIGMLIYKKTLGQYIVGIMSTIINQILHVVFKALGVLFFPVKWLISKGWRIVKKMKKYGKKQLTSNGKKVKILLCKHQRGKKLGRGYKENEGKSKSRLSGEKASE
ncbi:MAG: hypothetical protein HDR01_08110 [Lachnospiraceae bacterium]|nr:hypothetical protein [Lachnospiraceae bacterium]